MVKDLKNYNFTFGSLFSESFEELSKKLGIIFKSYVLVYFIPVLIAGLIVIFSMVLTYPTISGNAISDTLSNPYSSLISGDLPYGATAVFLLLIFLVIVVVIANVLLNLSYLHISFTDSPVESYSQIWEKVRGSFWKYIGFSLVSTIFLIGLFILFIIPGVIFSVFWVFGVYVLLNEDKGILESLGESRSLVRGRWWKTFGYLLLALLIYVGASIVLNFLPFAGAILSSLFINSFAVIFLKNFYLAYKNTKAVD